MNLKKLFLISGVALCVFSTTATFAASDVKTAPYQFSFKNDPSVFNGYKFLQGDYTVHFANAFSGNDVAGPVVCNTGTYVIGQKFTVRKNQTITCTMPASHGLISTAVQVDFTINYKKKSSDGNRLYHCNQTYAYLINKPAKFSIGQDNEMLLFGEPSCTWTKGGNKG